MKACAIYGRYIHLKALETWKVDKAEKRLRNKKTEQTTLKLVILKVVYTRAT